MVQNDLHKRTSAIQQKKEIRISPTYKSYDDTNDYGKKRVRYLAILLINTATSGLHIRNIVKSARVKLGWVLRMFQSQERSLMLTLFKSLVIPFLEYCCQLWNPSKAKTYKQLKLFSKRLHTKSLKYST